MSKKKVKGRSRGTQGGLNLERLYQQVQEDMLKAQEALAQETLEVSVGGGAVTVVIDGQQRVRSITIQLEVVRPDDVEMLQDLILAAVNQAIEHSRAMAAERLQSITGGLSLPGLL